MPNSKTTLITCKQFIIYAIGALLISLVIYSIFYEETTTIKIQKKPSITQQHGIFFTTEFFEKKFGGKWTSTVLKKKNYFKEKFQDTNSIIEIIHESWTFSDVKTALLDHRDNLENRAGIEQGQKYSIMTPIEHPPSPLDKLPLVFVARGPSDTVRMMLTVVAAEELQNYEKVNIVFCVEKIVHKITIVVRDPDRKVDPMALAIDAGKHILRTLV
jgi:hypothetical protein